MAVIYVPIIKSKRGELTAVKQLSKEIKKKLTLFLDVLPPSRFAPKPKPLVAHLDAISKHTIGAIDAGEELFVDTFDLGSPIVLGNRTALEYVHSQLRLAGLAPIPVYGFAREPEHEAAIRRLLQSVPRVCLRLEAEELELPKQLPTLLRTKLDQFKLTPADVHIVMDARYKQRRTEHELANLFRVALENLPDASHWRSIALAASSMPNSLSEACPRGQATKIARNEWKAWLSIRSMESKPLFADYTTVSPLFAETDPRLVAKHLGPNVKYTTELDWYVARGKSFQKFGGGQYFEIARAISNLKEFRGPKASYGDRFISERASGFLLKSGNPEQWITASVNSHITHVVQRISESRGLA